jgi:hypothetical protein
MSLWVLKLGLMHLRWVLKLGLMHLRWVLKLGLMHLRWVLKLAPQLSSHRLKLFYQRPTSLQQDWLHQ